MSKILLAGDTHENINAINRIIKKLALQGVEVNAVIQVGDFGFWAEGGEWKGFLKGVFKFRKPTYVVHGNHDDPACVEPMMGRTPQKNIHNFRMFYPGEILEICGLKVMGVGGAKTVDEHKIFHPFDPQIYKDVLERWWWAEEPRIDLLVTHEAPAGTGMLGDIYMSQKYNLNILDVGEPLLTELWEYVRPAWQINGHHHKIHEYTSPSGLKHLTLPCIEDGYGLLDTETMEIEIRREKTK